MLRWVTVRFWLVVASGEGWFVGCDCFLFWVCGCSITSHAMGLLSVFVGTGCGLVWG